MTTPVYKSHGTGHQANVQSAMQEQPEVASQKQQRFEQLLKKKPPSQIDGVMAKKRVEQPHCPSSSDQPKAEKRPRLEREEDDTTGVLPLVSSTPEPFHSPHKMAQTGIGRTDHIDSLSSMSANRQAYVELSMALDMLVEAACAPASSNLAANAAVNEKVELQVDVLSGPLMGAQMRVAAQQGKLQMTVRAANREQSAALDSIRHTLVNKVRSLDQFEVELEPERHSDD